MDSQAGSTSSNATYKTIQDILDMLAEIHKRHSTSDVSIESVLSSPVATEESRERAKSMIVNCAEQTIRSLIGKITPSEIQEYFKLVQDDTVNANHRLSNINDPLWRGTGEAGQSSKVDQNANGDIVVSWEFTNGEASLTHQLRVVSRAALEAAASANDIDTSA